MQLTATMACFVLLGSTGDDPTGACCLQCTPNDFICFQASEHHCLAVSGSYGGDGSECGSVLCEPLAACPPGCVGGAIAITLEAIVEGAPTIEVNLGAVVQFRVRLFNALPTGCNATGGQLSVRFPDSTLVPVAGFPDLPPVPIMFFEVPNSGYEFSVPETYVVRLEDVVELPNGQQVLLVDADYGSTDDQPQQDDGILLSNPPLAILNTSTTMQLAVILPCVGDVDDSGSVGVDDLTAVILEWGQPGGPADVDNDGIVGVDDLVEVLLNWGPCP